MGTDLLAMQPALMLLLMLGAAAGLRSEPELPPVCAGDCLPGECVGGESFQCTKCSEGRRLILETGKNYGRCITCASNCERGECVGERGDQCLKCRSDRVMVSGISKEYGTCVQCVNTCSENKCLGERADQCTGCDHPRVLVDLMAEDLSRNATRDAKPAVGTCTECASSCAKTKCIGPRSDQCTACSPERALVLRGNSTPGTCVECASNCLEGHCAGEHSYQCTKCAENKVLVHLTSGPDAGKGFGTCVSCSYTCKPLMCVGSEPHQCTECAEGRTLLPWRGNTFGECPANSVVSNQLLQARLKQEHEELMVLRHQRAMTMKQMRLKRLLAQRQQERREGTLLKEGSEVKDLSSVAKNPVLLKATQASTCLEHDTNMINFILPPSKNL